jgi:hypothetical protein
MQEGGSDGENWGSSEVSRGGDEGSFVFLESQSPVATAF